MDHVAGDQFARLHLLPQPIAQDSCPHGQPAAQKGQRGASAVLLDEADDHVEAQQRCHDQSFGRLPQGSLEDDRGLEHPGHGSPEFGQHRSPWVLPGLRRLIGSVLAEPPRGFLAGEPSIRLRIDASSSHEQMLRLSLPVTVCPCEVDGWDVPP